MNNTPMMKQYSAIKAKNQDAILFFRMGDFFEMFYEDAKVASKVLGLTLTSRNHGLGENVPLAGFPHHQLESYLAKMVKAGFKVAVCEQVEDPKKAKGLVKREVIEVVTAGSSLSERFLAKSQNNYLSAMVSDKDRMGLAYTDVSTGEFYTGEAELKEMRAELLHLTPAEIIYPQYNIPLLDQIGLNKATVLSQVDDWYFSPSYSEEVLKAHFGVISLRGLGLENLPLALRAAGAILGYLKEGLKRDCSQLRRIALISTRGGMLLDPATIRNLELFQSFSGNKEASLLQTIDRTVTAMGGRLLRKWLARPSTDASEIERRLHSVECLFNGRELRDGLKDRLKAVCDIERVTSRLTSGRGNPRDALGLLKTLQQLPAIIESLFASQDKVLNSIGSKIDPALKLAERLASALVDDPPFALTEGGIFRSGYNQRLDHLRKISGSGKEWIIGRQEEERVRTGIPNLKITYNKVFGYYIEVTKSHLEKVPQDYIRKQTLVNAERFITPELKEYEEEVLKAEEETKEIEYELFNELRYTIAGFTEILQNDAYILAELDVFLSFAETADELGYTRPQMEEGDFIELVDSRHPVVERLLPPGEKFIPNDLNIGGDLRMMLITGPNMAGKSTYLRQVALIVLMAHCGGFVPAKRARIGLVDRIFTRVGAQDNLVAGESTFLLEMNEAANILNHATNNSLIILDEIGRGTSTFDGLSIAWAISEYLLKKPELRSKTLFATHYHELTELESRLAGVKNFNILVKEWKNRIIFLRKIAPGGCDRSYGIQVARMAGLPVDIIERALEVLTTLEGAGIVSHQPFTSNDDQLSLFIPQVDKLRERLQDLEPDHLTPKEALEILYELKRMVGE
jgi:DNA mismatch repair protein MutS